TMGITGRRPDGPRRSMKVIPAPIVAPMSAAVRRSYSSSCPSSTSRTRTDARGCWDRLRGWLIVAVVAIPFLLDCYVVGRFGCLGRFVRIELVFELVGCKVHPTTLAERLRPAANSPN